MRARKKARPFAETRWTLREWKRPRKGRPYKLTKSEVRWIRRHARYSSYSPVVLARTFGVTRGHISNIVSGRRRADD